MKKFSEIGTVIEETRDLEMFGELRKHFKLILKIQKISFDSDSKEELF